MGEAVAGPSTWQEALLADYGAFLEGERAVSAGTIKHYRRCARVFLGWLGDAEACLARLEAAQVTAYVMDWARRREGARPDMVTLPALRSFLRFLHVAGHVRHLLVGVVPAGRAHPGVWQRSTGSLYSDWKVNFGGLTATPTPQLAQGTDPADALEIAAEWE